MSVFALEFPPVSHLFEWPNILFDDTVFGLNKTGLIYLAALLMTVALFWWAARPRESQVPTKMQMVAEGGVQFVEDNIVMQTIGPEGRRYMPLLVTLFFFIFFSNIFEVIPVIQFPANSRMAMPLVLALMVWAIYNFIGIRTQGVGGYLKSALFPPGVPKALYVIVTPIELVSTFLIRPLSLAIRLWANMVAGHLLLVTFAVLSASLWGLDLLVVLVPVTFIALILVTAFEIFVSILQAFIFTILTAVYIGSSLHPEH